MKNLIMTLALCLACMSGMAQKCDKSAKCDKFDAKFMEAKVAEMTSRLKLTDEQATAFRPVYEEYNNAMAAAWKECKEAKIDTTDACACVKAKLERQKKAIEIRIAYTDKFAKVLSGEQLRKFYNAENDIQRKCKGKCEKPGKCADCGSKCKDGKCDKCGKDCKCEKPGKGPRDGKAGKGHKGERPAPQQAE